MAGFFGMDPSAIISSIGGALGAIAPAPAPQGGFDPSPGAGAAFSPAPAVAGDGTWPTITLGGNGFQPAQVNLGTFQPSAGMGEGFAPAGLGLTSFAPSPGPSGNPFTPSFVNPLTNPATPPQQGGNPLAGGTAQAGAYNAQGVQGWIQQQRPNSPIAPIVPEIIAYAQSKGVDPSEIFGRLQAESGWATDSGMGTRQNNPGNIMAPGADPAHGKIILRAYPTMLDGVKAMIDTIASYQGSYAAYLGKQQLSLEDRVAIYYVGPEAYKNYGLQANDAGGSGPGGNGTVQDYLNRHIYPVQQALQQFFTPTAPAVGTPRGVPTPNLQIGTSPWAQAPGAIAVGQQFLGQPYVWGGESPQEGFDCSGLVQWAYGQVGVRNLPRTAQQQFDATQRIGAGDLRPGDLVFFTNTYETNEAVTHVGIFAGYDQTGRPIMLNSANGGVLYAYFDDPYWSAHLYGYGRVANAGAGGRY